ncbi:uncharacterized protein LOC129951575 [Eupeodes corollae]|uniref:uncharacterized protein LOC129951575 n=1 Tax=Eupeodes corollae TaxID=290404 RepID=UPI00248F6A38|nr:uncharacterized protein LOC129951575 [Eupeodes corollae]
MAEEFKWSKELTSELILNYEMHPILYNPCHPEYITNRVKKADAFQSLLNALKPFDPNITMDAIKRKIRTLRSQFSKELRETEKSKKSGAGADDLHEPKLWCYDQLVFLKTYCKTRTSESNIEENSEQNPVPSPSYHSSTQDSDFENNYTSKKKVST